MSFSKKFFSRIVGYASMSPNKTKDCVDLNYLRYYFLKIPGEAEIFAEEVHPNCKERPQFQEILDQIEKGAITTLIIPNLFHIAGNDVEALSRFLTLIEVEGVRLKSLKENLDSFRDPREKFILSVQQKYSSKPFSFRELTVS